MRREKLANAFAFGAASLSALRQLVGCAVSFWLRAQAHRSPNQTASRRSSLTSSLPSGSTHSARSFSSSFPCSVGTLDLFARYAKGFFGRKNVGVLGAFFNALLLATSLTFVADNVWLFLIAWEIMALTAYCLVSFRHEKPETRKAGVLYFIMSHIDAGCIILGFLLLFQVSGDYSFASLHDIGAKMSPGHRDTGFMLFLLGFGIKAGIVPLHIWLPVAHPVAPSNVSALMSGVLIKTGIYGLTRVCF